MHWPESQCLVYLVFILVYGKSDMLAYPRKNKKPKHVNAILIVKLS